MYEQIENIAKQIMNYMVCNILSCLEKVQYMMDKCHRFAKLPPKRDKGGAGTQLFCMKENGRKKSN
jgi:hypothetical protein